MNGLNDLIPRPLRIFERPHHGLGHARPRAGRLDLQREDTELIKDRPLNDADIRNPAERDRFSDARHVKPSHSNRLSTTRSSSRRM